MYYFFFSPLLENKLCDISVPGFTDYAYLVDLAFLISSIPLVTHCLNNFDILRVSSIPVILLASVLFILLFLSKYSLTASHVSTRFKLKRITSTEFPFKDAGI